MATTTPRQLSLLADHLKLSLLERQRAQALNLEPIKHDAQITRSLTEFRGGLEELEERETDLAVLQNYSSDLERLRRQYEELYALFHGEAPASAKAVLRRRNDEGLREDFEAAQQRPVGQAGRSKSVRFRDNPSAEDAEDNANRAALFAEQERYRDEPSRPDQNKLDNQQIHTYHKQVIREQDEQLDTLGQSVRRQTMLGIEMGSELEGQNEMLDDVERGVDRHSTMLERARRRLGNVARKSKDNWSWVTIGILICILVLLIVVLK